ncbi:MAG: hypothetical protein KME40_16905 [Komarekiella atlantica HA4396-MV6]|jgi:hypothetical protein|nr:hypothetical protein [Komarekiella atlantica HA4396-MV6]
MKSSLERLFEAINQAHSEHDLRSQIVPKISEYVAKIVKLKTTFWQKRNISDVLTI